MDEIPSDFDYSLLLQSDAAPPSSQPLPDFTDDLEALRTVAQERVAELTRKGVVIQHRLHDKTPVFRSSSLPPDSPTPKGRAFASSPPPPEDMEDSAEITPRPKPKQTKRFVPNFSAPLKGGLFGGVKKPVVEEEEEDRSPLVDMIAQMRGESPLPPPILHEEDQRLATLSLISQIEQEREQEQEPTPTPTPRAELPEGEKVTIVTSSGETFTVLRRERVFAETAPAPTVTATKTTTTTTGATPKYYGIDIHSLLDDLAASKAIAAATLPTAAATIEEPTIPAASHKKRLLWTEKYRAKKFTDLVGDERTHRDVLRWLKGWDKLVFPSQQRLKRKVPAASGEADEEPLEHRKILLLHGPPGLGKTTLAHVAARQAGYEPLEINASDDRTGGVVKGKIRNMLTIEGVKSCGLTSGKKKQIAGRPVCLVIDEIDGVTGGGGGSGSEAGFIKALIDLIVADREATEERNSGTKKKRRRRNGEEDGFRLLRPIIAVCNDLYAPALKPLRQFVEVVQMRVPPVGLLVERLEWIFEKEGYATEDGAVRKIVELSGSVSSRKGDMRGALVNGQWIAARLKSTGGRKRQVLTRSAVELELMGSRIGDSDGKGAGGGRMAMRDALESVFHIQKEPPQRRGAVKAVKKSSTQKLQELVEGLGEFDKLTTECFATYPTKNFNDDSCLTKPNAAYEWLWFADLLSNRVSSEVSSASYLTYPILAFHRLFASSTSSSSSRPDNFDPTEEVALFTGPSADWEAYEAKKENTSIIASIHSSIKSPRLSMLFNSPSIIAMELSPLANRMMSPHVNPVMVSGSGYAIASVRRDTEKRMVARAVDAMDALGVKFEKVRVEGIATGSGWAFRMDPPIDALGIYPTFKAPSVEPVRYAVRQVLDQEWRKLQALKDKLAAEARRGEVLGEVLPQPPPQQQQIGLKPAAKVKRDFFGRVISELPVGLEVAGDNPRKKRRVVLTEGKSDTWVTYNEGFSNAVRKGIRIDELMEGLI